jgi:hypothetical protein
VALDDGVGYRARVDLSALADRAGRSMDVVLRHRVTPWALAAAFVAYGLWSIAGDAICTMRSAHLRVR